MFTMYLFRQFTITRRTFICSKGLVKARSFQLAVQQYDAYRVKVVNFNVYCERDGIMAINPDKRTVYFVFGDGIEEAYTHLELTDRNAMPLVTFRDNLKYFHPDSYAHNIEFFNPDDYHCWWIATRR
jgi:hypothetical protein